MLNEEEKKLANLIDKHVQRHVGFAIYRLPYTRNPKLVVQSNGPLYTSNDLSELDGMEGFVLSPYTLKYNSPIVLVKPQFKAEGIEEIIKTLSDLPALDKDLPTPGLYVHNMTRAEYQEAFNCCKKNIESGRADKVVLARSQSFKTSISVGHLFAESCQKYPRMMIYLFFSPMTGVWLGCSPEILVDGHKGEWSTMALAGTQLYKENAEWDEKNRLEQQVVESYIKNILDSMGAQIMVGEPHTVRAGHLIHLRTDFKIKLPHEVGVGTIAKHLHPTPAICGRPCEVASEIIDTDEPTARLYYSGIVGYVSAEKESHLYVNLRCLTTQSGRVTIYAGGGIMKSSDADEEWHETEIKMDTMINILDQ
ncbi:MAG: isochorismate synthase [Bacteroidales bacterium]|nr:isochorismate synthase [Bacteroidales bacterium]